MITTEILNNANKEEFIDLARQINIFKTKKEPNYLELKNKVIELLPKFNLTKDDVVPIRIITHSDIVTTVLINK